MFVSPSTFAARSAAAHRLLFISVQSTSFKSKRRFSTDLPSSSLHENLSLSGDISVNYEFGLPVVTVPLPSRQELCQFALKPVTQTVGDFCDHVRDEDRGVDIVALFKTDGTRISSSTPVEHIMQLEEFHVRINDKLLAARPPGVSDDAGELQLSSEHVKNLGDLKTLVGSLHASLNVDEHQLKLEQELLHKLEQLRTELRPLEELKQRIVAECEARTQKLLWLGLGAMGIQFGLFGRLTWWEYSWDIMEPVTYFATYTTVIAGFAYFVLTKQNYEYPEAKDRLFLSAFYRKAKKHQFDIQKYNRIKEAISEVQYDLRRLRDPLYLHLPLNRLTSLAIKQAQAKARSEES